MDIDQNRLVQAGGELRRLFQSDALKLAFKLLEDSYVEQWMASDYGDDKGREQTYRQLQALRDLSGTINALVHQFETDNDQPLD